MPDNLRNIEIVSIAEPTSWRKRLIVNNQGKILPNHHNVSLVLTESPEWARVFAYNEFSRRVEAIRATPWIYQGPWSDVQDTKILRWLQEHGIDARLSVVGPCILECAHHSSSRARVLGFVEVGRHAAP